MSIVRKSAQYYHRAFISINGRRINYEYIMATNSFMCVITIFRLYNMEENCLIDIIYIYHIHIYITIKFLCNFKFHVLRNLQASDCCLPIEGLQPMLCFIIAQ